MAAPSIVRDPDRLRAVRRLGLLDAPAKAGFDRLTQLAAELLEAPIALMTLVEADRQFFVSCVGLPDELRQARQTPLEYSLCQHALGSSRPLVAPDARRDPVLAEVQAVTEYGIRTYAGAPLTFDHQPVGALCVLDRQVRDWRPDQVSILQRLADVASDELCLHAFEGREARQREWSGVASLRPTRLRW